MRSQVLHKLSELGLLADADATDYILAKEDPLSFCTGLTAMDISVLTREYLEKLEKRPEPGLEKVSGTVHKPKPRTKDIEPIIDVIKNHKTTKAKADIGNFVSYYTDRYERLKALLVGRAELGGAISITHATRAGDKVKLIGIVQDIRTTTNGHKMIELEDPTGSVNVLVGKYKGPLLKEAENLVFDEVIGVAGTVGDGILFCDQIIWPEIPIIKEKKPVEDDVSVVFLSDLHIGSSKFMETDFLRFVDWLNGRIGNKKQVALAQSVGYVLVAGDIVDGVGIYPNQEAELDILDIHKQFEKASEYFQMFPDNVKIIISPGNHDAVRLPQPQPPLVNRFTDSLDLDNVLNVSNPAYVRLHDARDVLIYHGVSFDGLIATMPSLTDGYNHPELVAKELLRRRHLSPSHGMDIAAEEEDKLVIDKVPDIFHNGHVHTNGHLIYRGVRIINSGAFQAQTSFQKLVGHEPTPAKVPILNLKTEQLRVMNFASSV